jgi:hypothetical protein
VQGLVGSAKSQDQSIRTGRDTHLLGNRADLLGWQVVEGEYKPPVEVALATQGAVVYICLLLMFFKAHHPARHTC